MLNENDVLLLNTSEMGYMTKKKKHPKTITYSWHFLPHQIHHHTHTQQLTKKEPLMISVWDCIRDESLSKKIRINKRNPKHCYIHKLSVFFLSTTEETSLKSKEMHANLQRRFSHTRAVICVCVKSEVEQIKQPFGQQRWQFPQIQIHIYRML